MPNSYQYAHYYALDANGAIQSGWNVLGCDGFHWIDERGKRPNGAKMTKQSRRLMVRSLVALIPALSLGCVNAQAQPSPEEMWKEFLEWLPKAPANDGPPSALFAVYRDLLVKAGVSVQE